MLRFAVLLLLPLMILQGTQLGAQRRNSSPERYDFAETGGAIDEMELEYGRYMQQVMQILEADKSFKIAADAHLLNGNDIHNDKFAHLLHLVEREARTRLDEMKRIELDRIKHLVKKMRQLESKEHTPFHQSDFHGHLDRESDQFGVEDLRRLIAQTSADLANIDRRRELDYKRYKMEQELMKRTRLAALGDARRERAREQRRSHEHINHPGSKRQLQEVWQWQDHLPLSDFDRSIFFALHDINSDRMLEPDEVESMLLLEVDKIYPDHVTQSAADREEEIRRMRAHVYRDMDRNRDGLISAPEFTQFTDSPRWNSNSSDDEAWIPIEDENGEAIFTEQELEQYRQQKQQQKQHLSDVQMI